MGEVRRVPFLKVADLQLSLVLKHTDMHNKAEYNIRE